MLAVEGCRYLNGGRKAFRVGVRMRWCLLVLCCGLLVGCGLSRQVNKAINGKDARFQKELADDLYKKKKYSYARKLYENILPFFRNDREYSKILFHFALCAYYQEDYTTTITVLKNVRDNVSSFFNKQELNFYIVKSYDHMAEPYVLQQENTEHAISEATQFISLYPSSTYVDSCVRIIAKNRKILEKKAFASANLYFKMGYFKSAVIGFQGLLLTYPESDKLDFYQYLLIKASEKLLASTVEEKKLEREASILTAISNFRDQFPESPYEKEVSLIAKKLHLDLEKNKKKQ